MDGNQKPMKRSMTAAPLNCVAATPISISFSVHAIPLSVLFGLAIGIPFAHSSTSPCRNWPSSSRKVYIKDPFPFPLSASSKIDVRGIVRPETGLSSIREVEREKYAQNALRQNDSHLWPRPTSRVKIFIKFSMEHLRR